MRLHRLSGYCFSKFRSEFCSEFSFPAHRNPSTTNRHNQRNADRSERRGDSARSFRRRRWTPRARLQTRLTAADGKFSLTLAPGRYRLSVQHPSFARVEQEFTLAPAKLALGMCASSLSLCPPSDRYAPLPNPPRLKTPRHSWTSSPEKQIEQRQQIWLTPSAQGDPGISFSQLGPMGGSTTFFLDGGNSNYTKVLIDGVPVNQPGGLVDFSNFTLDGIDKIEVVHGASSALYGSDAMDGVMQIFTHRGTTSHPVLELEGDGGTFDTGHGTGQLSGLAGAFDYSAGAAISAATGKGRTISSAIHTLSGNFGWKFSDTDSLRLTLRNNSSDAGQPGQTRSILRFSWRERAQVCTISRRDLRGIFRPVRIGNIN